jgi:predicted enzyme related to lactoylglutathione lyase
MSERTSYPPGTFSWADLTTSDAEDAKRFYGELHGWEFDESPVPQGGVYVMVRKDGANVAGLSESADHPPHWNNYVTVESADAAARRGEELGGTVVMPAFDVMDVGRMAMLQDPTGAMLCVWEPRSNIGAGRVNEPGAMTWNDLTTPDAEAASTFYGEWLGWRIEEIPEAYGYRVIYNGDRSNGGILPRRPDMGDVPPNWMPYFGTEDVEQAVGRVKELGGQVLTQPMPVPNGAFIVIADPQGAVSALWSGVYDD